MNVYISLVDVEVKVIDCCLLIIGKTFLKVTTLLDFTLISQLTETLNNNGIKMLKLLVKNAYCFIYATC